MPPRGLCSHPGDQAIPRPPPSWVNSTPTFFQKWSENSPASSFLPPLLSLGLSSLRNKSVSSQISPGEAWASVRLGADLISQVKQLTLRCEHPQATEGRLEERRQRDRGGGRTQRWLSQKCWKLPEKTHLVVFQKWKFTPFYYICRGSLPPPLPPEGQKASPWKEPCPSNHETLCNSVPKSLPATPKDPPKGTVTASHQPHTPTYSRND